MNEIKKERLIELLTDETLFGLDEPETTELYQLKRQFPEWESDVSFELAAAAINLENLDTSEELPVDLRAKILADADNFFGNAEKAPNVVSFPTKSKKNAVYANRTFDVSSEQKRPFWQWLGWGVAAAACIALAVNLWVNNSRLPNDAIVRKPEAVQTPVPELSPSQKREQLIATASDAIQTNWTAPKDEKQILGDIVWSNEKQTGYMRFRGLPANAPGRESYQLWIVDEEQDPKTPVSGGVFDVNENGEAIVPINAQIMIRKPKVFAVTKEKYGGVVVSKQKEFMAVAKI